MTDPRCACPDCGAPLVFEEKDTSSGVEVREYRCEKCGKSVIERGGTAVWKALHDADESSGTEKPGS